MVTSLREEVQIIPVSGLGYLAGEAPTGLVTLDNVPGRAVIDLFLRGTNAWVGRQVSSGSGTYRFNSLPLGTEFNIVGRDVSDNWGDVIVSRVEAYAPPHIITSSLNFTTGDPATTQMAALYGGLELAWSIDTLPPGLSMDATGLWSGTPTTAGSTDVVITVEDEFGEIGTRSFTVVVT